LGLDSLDFLVSDTSAVLKMLQAAQAQVVEEHNDMHAWVSLRFGGAAQYEAKFIDHLVLDVGIKELRLAETKILQLLGRR
jgi:hypothetical protein